MKKLAIALLLLTTVILPRESSAQVWLKLNGLYALVGVINPAVEFAVSPHSTVQTEIVISPWKSINGYHAMFGILMGEYRYHFKGHNRGWYVGGNLGMMAFDLSKPYIANGGIHIENSYSKGYGFMIGACVGYEYVFRERWIIDTYLGWAWMDSHYNGYSLDGEINMNPHRPVQPKHPDPFNGSSEWYPNKIGLSIGYRIFNPDKLRK